MRLPRMTLRALLVSLMALVTGLVVLPAAPASAETTILCRGFAGCNAAGYGNDGYEHVYRQMHWRMYGGHNCTNYVAYRLIRAGMSTDRPWSGSGNASNWGVAMADKVDQTPMVGAVAWWRDRNHVQYVEHVYGPGHIVVSEDHWGGDFNWARIRKGDGSNWPDGFIHLRDARVENLTRPTIAVEPRVGETVTGDRGTWDPTGRFDYQWLANGWPIEGATGISYTPRPEDYGKQLSLRVVAHKYAYLSRQRNTERTVEVKAGFVEVTGQPTISGVPKVGATLTASPATFEPAADRLSVRWFADDVLIDGQNDWQLKLTGDQLDKRITAQVTGRQHGYQTRSSKSEPTEPVGPENIGVVEPASLHGSPELGRTLRIDPGKVAVSDARLSYVWLRDGVRIDGARSLTYTPTVADLGDRIAARVSYSKPGYRTVAWNLTLDHPVRSVPRLRLSSPAKRTVAVTVDAPGVATVGGQVTLGDGKYATTLPLRNGRAVFSSNWIPAGWYKFRAEFHGSSRVAEGARRDWVVVRGIAR